jgi:hypothetical protein
LGIHGRIGVGNIDKELFVNMSYADIVETHSITTGLKNTIILISEIRSRDGLNQQHEPTITRIHSVLHMFETLLYKADPLFIAIGTLENANLYINNMHSYLVEYSRNPLDQYINSANNQADAITLLYCNFFVPSTKEEVDGIKEASISFRQSIAQHLRYASEEFEEFKDSVKSLQKEVLNLQSSIESEKLRVDSITAEYQRQFSNSEASRQAVFTSANDKRTETFDQEIENYNDEFSSLRKELIKIRDDQQSQTDQLQTDLENQAKTIIESLQSSQEKAKKILGTLSIDSHAAGYQKVANSARDAKNLWYFVTGGLFILLIASAIWNMFHNQNEAFSWSQFASKWSVTMAIGTAVTYFARQAAKQDRAERENRHMELQMATIDPYLEVFDETERKEIKRLLVDRIFTGKNILDEQPSNDGIRVSDAAKLIETVGSIMNRK